MKIRNLMLMLAMAFSVALLTGCNFDGGVEQGRCVAYDATAKTLTIVVDVTHDQFNPHYSGGTGASPQTSIASAIAISTMFTTNSRLRRILRTVSFSCPSALV